MNEFEYNKKYKRGNRTFLFLGIKNSWHITIVGIAILYLTYEIYFGRLQARTTMYLARHSDWYIDISMLSLWLFLLGISVLFIGYLKANVQYRHFRFILDEDAFHLHRGLFFIKETTIPYKQISNVHIARPYHYRLFGVAQLDVVTAADKSLSHVEVKTKEFLIPIIDTVIARKLAKHLISQSGENSTARRATAEQHDTLEDTDPRPDSEVYQRPSPQERSDMEDGSESSIRSDNTSTIHVSSISGTAKSTVDQSDHVRIPDLAGDLARELEQDA
jgi:membrane protein YdbS with pleckstrin-like domain